MPQTLSTGTLALPVILPAKLGKSLVPLLRMLAIIVKHCCTISHPVPPRLALTEAISQAAMLHLSSTHILHSTDLICMLAGSVFAIAAMACIWLPLIMQLPARMALPKEVAQHMNSRLDAAGCFMPAALQYTMLCQLC